MAAKHVVKTGKNNYSATNKAGKVIGHSGHMSKEQAAKQVEAIYISQHGIDKPGGHAKA